MDLSDLKLGDVLLHEDGEIHMFTPYEGENSRYLSKGKWQGYRLDQTVLDLFFAHCEQNNLLTVHYGLGDKNGSKE